MNLNFHTIMSNIYTLVCKLKHLYLKPPMSEFNIYTYVCIFEHMCLNLRPGI